MSPPGTDSTSGYLCGIKEAAVRVSPLYIHLVWSNILWGSWASGGRRSTGGLAIPSEAPSRLPEAKTEGGDLHGVKVDGGAVGGGCGQWVHQRQGEGLQGDQVQALEQAAEGERALGGGAVEAQIPGLQATVKALPVQDQRNLGRWQRIILPLQRAKVEKV